MTGEELTTAVLAELWRTDGYVILYLPHKLDVGATQDVSDEYECKYPFRVVGYGTREDALRQFSVLLGSGLL